MDRSSASDGRYDSARPGHFLAMTGLNCKEGPFESALYAHDNTGGFLVQSQCGDLPSGHGMLTPLHEHVRASILLPSRTSKT